MAGHSPIGASSYYRWGDSRGGCPGSVKLSEGIESNSSSYAQEGTLAHEYVAEVLLGRNPPEVPDEMKEFGAVYIDYIKAYAKQKHVEVLIEQKLDLSELHPQLFGTADALIYDHKEKTLEVVDFKYGAGVPVEVKDNSQMQYYGLGGLLKDQSFPCKRLRLTVVQPRAPHSDGPIRSWDLPAIEIFDFASDLVSDAKETENPKAILRSGDHCRWCPAAAICPKLISDAQALAKEVFKPEVPYDAEKLSHALTWLPVLEAWVKSLRAFAYEEATQGRVPPGFKLVEKRATRKWIDEKEIEDWLLSEVDMDEDLIYTMKLKSPAQMEKVGNAAFKKELKKFIKTQSSGTTLVPEDDKRKEVILAEKAFEELPASADDLF